MLIIVTTIDNEMINNCLLLLYVRLITRVSVCRHFRGHVILVELCVMFQLYQLFITYLILDISHYNSHKWGQGLLNVCLYVHTRSCFAIITSVHGM